jgi:glycosyltransferase involved in cell wall biosynthesis
MPTSRFCAGTTNERMTHTTGDGDEDGATPGSDQRVDRRQLRILILTPSLPFPLIWGFGIRVYQFVRLLARHHRVFLLTYAEPGDADKVAAIESLHAAVHTVPRPTETDRSKRLGQLSSIFSRMSYQRRSLYSGAMQEKLHQLTSQERFDVIQVESSQLAGFEFGSRSAVVVDEHNIEYELLYRMYRTEHAVVRRFYNWLEFNKFRREEIGTWRSVSGCVSTSAREQDLIREIVPRTPTVVVANAVDVDYFSPSDESIDDNALVMTGLMHYRPNIDGALYFLQEIFPHILASRPKMVFYIVGKGAPEELKRLAGANAVVTDTVPDVRPYVHKAAVFVVPLRMGGGTRLKVLEGLSMEKAVVSTSIGCEGIDVTHGEHLLIADEPLAFADSVLKLLSDRELAAKLGRQGRALIERQYRWETVVARLETFYGELLAGTPAPYLADGDLFRHHQ